MWIEKKNRPAARGHYVCYIPYGSSIHFQEIYFDGYQFDDDDVTHYAPARTKISEAEAWGLPVIEVQDNET